MTSECRLSSPGAVPKTSWLVTTALQWLASQAGRLLCQLKHGLLLVLFSFITTSVFKFVQMCNIFDLILLTSENPVMYILPYWISCASRPIQGTCVYEHTNKCGQSWVLWGALWCCLKATTSTKVLPKQNSWLFVNSTHTVVHKHYD